MNEVPDTEVVIGIGAPCINVARRRHRIQIQCRLLIQESEIKGRQALVVDQSRIGTPAKKVLGHMYLWNISQMFTLV